MSATESIYRYTYTSPLAKGGRFTARVTLYERMEHQGMILLLLRPIGRWPDREDLSELADEAEKQGVPMVKGVLLFPENEVKWREENLRPEDSGEWAGEAAA